MRDTYLRALRTLDDCILETKRQNTRAEAELRHLAAQSIRTSMGIKTPVPRLSTDMLLKLAGNLD